MEETSVEHLLERTGVFLQFHLLMDSNSNVSIYIEGEFILQEALAAFSYSHSSPLSYQNCQQELLECYLSLLVRFDEICF